MTSSPATGTLSSWSVRSGVNAPPPARSFALLRRDRRIGLNLLRDDHQEVGLRPADEALHALGLHRLIRRAQLIGVVTQQVLEIELALGVEYLELHLGALAEAALDRCSVQSQLVADANVDASAGHPGAGPGANVPEHDRPARGHVFEGEPLGVRAVDHAALRIVKGLLRLTGEHHVRPREPDAESRVGRPLNEEAASLRAVGEGLADRAVDPLTVSVRALHDRDGAPEHGLADAVLGAALDPAGDAPLVEGAEALPRDRASVEDELRELVVLAALRRPLIDPRTGARTGELGPGPPVVRVGRARELDAHAGAVEDLVRNLGDL